MKMGFKKIQDSFKKTWKVILLCFLVVLTSFYILASHFTSGNMGSGDLIYRVESKILDFKLVQRGPAKTKTQVGILAIDEKALQEFGRWPFSRHYYAKAFNNLKKNGVKLIGFDAVWSEPEKTYLEDAKAEYEGITPANIKEKISNINEMIKISPSDRIFFEGIKNFGNIVMGFFYFGSKGEANASIDRPDKFRGLKKMAETSAISLDLLPAGKKLSDYGVLSRGYGIVANTALHSEASDQFAFFSNDPDEDAINRWATLVTAIDEYLMPSLSLKSAASFLGREILVIFDGTGIDSIALSNPETEDVLELPVDSYGRGRLLLNHRGRSGAFHHYSLASAYNDTFSEKDKKNLKGSLLLLGATATGINDMRPNPFDPAIDGVENHAAALDNILTKNFLKRPKEIFKTELIIVIAVGLFAAPLMIWGNALWSGLAVLFFLIGYFLVDKYFWFGRGIWTYTAVPATEMIVMFIGSNLIKYMSEEKDKKFLKEAFGSYISPELIDEMYGSGEPPKLGGNSGILTAYFTDIQGFSSFSEKLSATKLVELLNEYLTAMTDILLEEKGTLDKYEGDAIIAFFGAPLALPDHATRACIVALKMQDSLLQLRKKWESEGEKWPQIVKEMRMRIGINTGEIVTGNMGSRDRMNYTMMGDSVNLAARLEEAAKQYGIFTHISHFTRDLAGPEKFVMRELDTIRVVGKKEPVTTYELMGVKDKTPQGLVKLAELFTGGLVHYKAKNWDEAIKEFEQSLELEYARFPDLKGKKTNPSLIYIERCAEFKKSPPPEDWDGVYTLTSK